MNQQDNSLNYGLNARGRSSKRSVFQDDEDSISSLENDTQGGRHLVNKELSKEQHALRKRAEEQIHSAQTLDSNIFDYDDHYESFSTLHQQKSQLKPETHTSTSTEKKESRYISSLLHQAKFRQQEQEIVKERKIAKEQAEEENKEEFKGKDRFITKAFKRKLQEREEWLKNDEEQRKREELEDATKKKAGENILFAGLYSNLQRNVRTQDPRPTVQQGKITIENKVIENMNQSNLHEVRSVGEDTQMTLNHLKFANSDGATQWKLDNYVQLSHSSVNENEPHDDATDIQSARLTKVLHARKRYLDRLKAL